MRPLSLKIFLSGSLNRAAIYALSGAMICVAVVAVYFYRNPSNTVPTPVHVTDITQSESASSPTITAEIKSPASPVADIAPPTVSPRASYAAAHPHPRAAEPIASTYTFNRNTRLDTLLHDAYQAYQSKELDTAQHLYRDVLAIEQNNLDALLGIAAIAQRRGLNVQAVQSYQKVLVLDPHNAFAHAGMAALHAEEDQESRLKLLLLEQESSAALHLALGNLYAAQARWSEAQQAYFDAHKLAPDNPEFAFNLAISLERLGQKKAASQFYLRALQLDASARAGFDHAVIAQRAQKLAE